MIKNQIFLTEISSLLIYLIIAICLIRVLVRLSLILKKRNNGLEKLSPYECGFQPFNIIRLPFNISYYFIALMFILFDIEVIFLIPLIFIGIQKLRLINYLIILFFLCLIIISLIYEWIIGAFKFILYS